MKQVSASRLRPKLAAGGPVVALDVGDENIDRFSLATQNFNTDAGDCLNQLFLLLQRAAFEHFDMVSGHGFLSVGWFWAGECAEGRRLCIIPCLAMSC